MMANFGGLLITNKGRALQAKAQTGVELKYTRMAIGDGQLAGQQIPNLDKLISEKMTLKISKLQVQPGGKAVVGSSFSNKDVAAGFYFREIGVFAKDPDVGEILYCYGNAGQNAEFIPPSGGADIIEKAIDVITIVGNAPNVTATIDSSLIFVTKKEFELTVLQVEEGIEKVREDLSGHEKATLAHGATADLTPNRIAIRDADGQFKVGKPTDPNHVARLMDVGSKPDYSEWTTRTTPVDNNWNNICYGNGTFVAISANGTGNRVMTSLDGVTWTLRQSAADINWRGVCYGNGLFVAVSSSGTGNRIMTSPDGINWTLRQSAADNTWNAICYGNGMFVVVDGSTSDNKIMTSPDGINWTVRP
ncbi:phage tail protein, partial [Paenibacillus azoreducens]|uniref:phage tail-collar fiber domain-containing protein n=1 Tax=Paenibacillus azoreducens TaxID=116718 RepID=UPI0039F532A3